jgi:hypothetical protein
MQLAIAMTNKLSTLLQGISWNLETDAILILCWMAVFVDLYVFGMGDVNSRWLSFLDSFSHCSSWSIDNSELVVRSRVIGAIISKYGSGLVTSLLLGVTPSFLQTNTSLAFALALALAHSNTNLASLVRSRHGRWRFLFVFIGSLHKSRKLRFAASTCGDFFQCFVIGILSVELTGWLVVATRAHLGGNNPFVALAEFIYRYRWRFLFTCCAVFATYFQLHPLMQLFLLMLHKTSTPNESGNVLMYEVY